MVKTVQINMSNKVFYTLVLIGILIVFSWGVVAYTTDGSGTPSVMGHSAGEIEEADPTVNDYVKDKSSCEDITGGAGLCDGVDNTEIRSGYGCTAFSCKVHCYAVHGSPWVDVTHTFVPSSGHTICLLYPEPFYVGTTHNVIIRSQTGGSYRCNCP